MSNPSEETDPIDGQPRDLPVRVLMVHFFHVPTAKVLHELTCEIRMPSCPTEGKFRITNPGVSESDDDLVQFRLSDSPATSREFVGIIYSPAFERYVVTVLHTFGGPQFAAGLALRFSQAGWGYKEYTNYERNRQP